MILQFYYGIHENNGKNGNKFHIKQIIIVHLDEITVGKRFTKKKKKIHSDDTHSLSVSASNGGRWPAADVEFIIAKLSFYNNNNNKYDIPQRQIITMIENDNNIIVSQQQY